jgi:hypothetical protein
LTPELFKGISKFQNSEYEVHQVGSNKAGCLKFRLKTHGNAAWQTDFFFRLNSFFRYKKPIFHKWKVKNQDGQDRPLGYENQINLKFSIWVAKKIVLIKHASELLAVSPILKFLLKRWNVSNDGAFVIFHSKFQIEAKFHCFYRIEETGKLQVKCLSHKIFIHKFSKHRCNTKPCFSIKSTRNKLILFEWIVCHKCLFSFGNNNSIINSILNVPYFHKICIWNT